MNVVIYTRDMEPITVIDLPKWALDVGEKRRFVQVAVTDPVTSLEHLRSEDINQLRSYVVTLEFCPITLRKAHSWVIVADDDILALKLHPAWLPGQQRQINEFRRINRELSAALLSVLARGVGGH